MVSARPISTVKKRVGITLVTPKPNAVSELQRLPKPAHPSVVQMKNASMVLARKSRLATIAIQLVGPINSVSTASARKSRLATIAVQVATPAKFAKMASVSKTHRVLAPQLVHPTKFVTMASVRKSKLAVVPQLVEQMKSAKTVNARKSKLAKRVIRLVHPTKFVKMASVRKSRLAVAQPIVQMTLIVPPLSVGKESSVAAVSAQKNNKQGQTPNQQQSATLISPIRAHKVSSAYRPVKPQHTASRNVHKTQISVLTTQMAEPIAASSLKAGQKSVSKIR